MLDDSGGDAVVADLGFTVAELRAAMRANYDDLLAFFYSAPFQAIHAAMARMAPRDRSDYVRDVLINPGRLRTETGIEVPDGILIQRSAFGDRRPTVYCLKKWLPKHFHPVWENTNLTFDEAYDDAAVTRAPDQAWRAPLRPDVQAILVAAGHPMTDLPDSFRVPNGSPDPRPVTIRKDQP